MDVRYILRILGRLFIFAALFALVLDICYHVVDGSTNTVTAIDVEEGSIDMSVSGTAAVVLSERVIELSENGLYLYTASEGERVSTGSKIADIYEDSSRNRELCEQIENLNYRISLLKKAQNLESAYSLASVEKSIRELRVSLSESLDGNDLGTSGTLSDELSVLLNVKELKNGHKTSYKTEIEKLTTERDAKISALGKATGTLKATVPGYFFSSCDGYEQLFGNTDLIDRDIEGLTEAFGEHPLADKAKKAKLVTDHVWRLILPVERRLITEFPEGKIYDVSVNGNVYGMTLEKIVSSTGNRDAFLIFSYNRMPDEFFPTRLTNISVVYKKNSGYLVPLKCLRKIDGVTGIYALHGSVVKFRAVKVISTNDVFAVCERDYAPEKSDYRALKNYDKIITKGKELYDGKIVD